MSRSRRPGSLRNRDGKMRSKHYRTEANGIVRAQVRSAIAKDRQPYAYKRRGWSDDGPSTDRVAHRGDEV